MLNRKIILFFSFIVGFSIMVVELTAARIVAPVLGSSIYTWTSVIGIVLLGTSLGNYTGGRIIDKKNSPLTGALFLGLASIAILFIPIISTFAKNITSLHASLWILVLIFSALLFLIPSFFLGSIYPIILKFYLHGMSSAGKEAGLVSAMGALGSILGTFLTGFIFIGYIGSTYTIILISVILFFCSFWLLPKNKLFLLYGLFYLTVFFIFLFIQNKTAKNPLIIFNKESDYFAIKVIDKYFPFSKVRLLYLDTDAHSVETGENDNFLNEIYTNYYPAFSALNNNHDIKNIAVLGGGSLAMSEKFKKYYSDATVTTAEIDPTVTKVAEKYFNISTEVIQNTVPADGRLFLVNSDKKYDIIFSDVFNSFISIPWHMATKEFFLLAKSRLEPNGAFAINFVSAQTGKESALFQSIFLTFTKVFDNYYVFACGNDPSETQNIILIGISSTDHLSDEIVQEKLISLPNSALLKKHFNTNHDKDSQAIVLTDNFAPTDRLMLPAINHSFPMYVTQLRSFLQNRF